MSEPDPAGFESALEAELDALEGLAGLLGKALGVPVRLERGAECRVGEQESVASVRLDGLAVGHICANLHVLPVDRHEAARELLTTLAGSTGRLLDRQEQLRQRIAELGAVSEVSMALTGPSANLRDVLEASLRSIIRVMGVKAGSIRLLERPGSDEMTLRAWVNLSDAYFAKGPIFAHESELDMRALAGEVVYVEDLRRETRIRFPDVVEAEGLRSFMCTGMIVRGRPVGVMRLYTAEVRTFSEFERGLLKVAAQQVALGIVNRRLLDEQREARQIRRQVALAAEVQRRMLPQDVPNLPRLDIAARCLPSLELGGDFYDFLPLGRSLGLAIGDVVGKGVPAALLMASVRAGLRAHALDLYDLDEIMSRTNRALAHDTQDHEFATLWYGVIDSGTLRLTYSNAGHEPALIVRPRAGDEVEVITLNTGGMAMGVDASQRYHKGVFDLRAGDALAIYSDGLSEAMNFDGEKFGRERILQAIRDVLRVDGEANATTILNHVLWEVRRFTGFNPQGDDMTLVVVRVG